MTEKKRKPILLFTSREICYYSADFFANQIADELEKAGYPVQICILDTQKDLDMQLDTYMGKEYTAIIDFNSLLPRMVLDSGDYYVDQLHGPFFNYLVDHPYYHHPGICIPLKNYHAICIDEYHVAYAKKYYPHLKSVSLLPLGATKALLSVPFEEKKEEILFIGTYNSSEKAYEQMKALPERLYEDDKAVLDMMLADPYMPQENALKTLLQDRGEELGIKEFAIRMNQMYHVDRFLRNYYREEAIRTLVKAHIPVTVMGNNWEKWEQGKESYLTIRPPVDFSMTFQKMSEYAVMLNVSPLFKAGAHDRVFGAMANESACLTDKNIFVDRNFAAGKDIAMYSLENMNELPDIACELLRDRQKRKMITKNAATEFDLRFSWEKRTEQLINIIKKEQ